MAVNVRDRLLAATVDVRPYRLEWARQFERIWLER
jgi:hypothetical protein